MATTYQLITSTTLTSGAATISFTSIPQTYTDLLLKMSLRQASACSGSQLGVRFNNSQQYYGRISGYGNGSAVSAPYASGEDHARFGFAASSTFTANTFGVYEMYITSYAGSYNKAFSTDSVAESNSATVEAVGIWTGMWNDTPAITSITIQDLAGTATNFATHSSIELYGISNA